MRKAACAAVAVIVVAAVVGMAPRGESLPSTTGMGTTGSVAAEAPTVKSYDFEGPAATQKAREDAARRLAMAMRKRVPPMHAVEPVTP